MAFAQPVSRDGFYYNDDLYVQVGNFNRHKRATVEEISALLRPNLKKASSSPPKDQVGHWYEAQLIHYGLPPSKDKARAKMRLLDALNQSKLTVPPNIAKLEAAMKREFTAAEKKAKIQFKPSQASAKKSGLLGVDKKRKRSEPSGNTNIINVNIGLGNDVQQPSGHVNATNSRPPAKKVKSSLSNPTKKKTAQISSSKPLERTPELKTERPFSLGLINGIYDLSCSTVQAQWSHTNPTLTLSLDGTTLWGAYDLGIFSGILFLPHRPWQASLDPLRFTSRGRAIEEEGIMSATHGCEGEISFLGEGVVEGWIGVFGCCAFRGVRRPEAGTAVRAAWCMREEWEGYDEEERGVELEEYDEEEGGAELEEYDEEEGGAEPEEYDEWAY